MSNKNYIGVILPGDIEKKGGPTFDKIVAYYFFLTAMGMRDEDLRVEFYGSSEPKDTRVQKLIGEGLFPIDVGGHKYQSQKKESAAEVVASRLGISGDSVVRELVTMANTNNQTGYLKGFSQSLVWALREAYKVERDPRVVVRKVLTAIDVFFQLFGKDKDDVSWKKRNWDKESREYKTLKQVISAINGDYRKQFTFPWLVRGMFELGMDIGHVRDTALWWLRVFNAAGKAQKTTQTELDQLSREEFNVSNGLSGCVIHSDNPMAGRELIHQEYAVVVVVSSSGNVAIIINQKFQLDMGAVANALNHEDRKVHERDVWCYDSRMQAVLNGSNNWDQPPTSLTPSGIINIVQSNIRKYRPYPRYNHAK